MDSRVPQRGSRQTRPALNACDGRSALEIGRPPMATTLFSDISEPTGSGAVLFLGLRGPAQGLRDPQAQMLGHLFPALLRDHDAQLRLEVESLAARGAVIEVMADDLPALEGQLAVEVVVQGVGCVPALVLSHTPILRAPRSGLAGVQIRTTASAAPFFHDAGDSSPSRWECRGSRRSPCTRTPPRRRGARRCGTVRAGTRAPP